MTYTQLGTGMPDLTTTPNSRTEVRTMTTVGEWPSVVITVRDLSDDEATMSATGLLTPEEARNLGVALIEHAAEAAAEARKRALTKA